MVVVRTRKYGLIPANRTNIGSRPLTMVAGPIVGEATGGPEDSCLCADDVVPDMSAGGPPLDAPIPHLGGNVFR